MLVKCYELITRTSYSWIFLLEVLLFVDITILTTSAKYLKKIYKKGKKDYFTKIIFLQELEILINAYLRCEKF